jgi:hypothetical protein
MKITITIRRLDCQSTKACGCQFIGDHALCYKGCYSDLTQKILLMLVRGAGIRDIAEIEKISIKKVLSVSVNSRHLEEKPVGFGSKLKLAYFGKHLRILISTSAHS